MLRILLPLSLAAVASMHACAGELLRCVGADGHVTYTQERCPDGTKLTSVRQVTPDDEPPVARPSYTPPTRAQQSEFRNNAPRAPTEGDRRKLRCAETRERVALERDRMGTRRTLADLRRWDREVTEACKGL